MSSEKQSETPKRTNEETPIENKSPARPIGKPSTSETPKEGEEEETLYKALINIGVSNVTTLMSRLGISREGGTALEKGKEEIMHDNAKNLLKLMELDETKNETVMLLEKIGLQGRDMLGEIPKPTIASAPIGKWRREIKPEQSKKPES